MEKIIIANSYDKKQEIINYLGDKIIYKNNNSRIILADLEVNQEEYLIKNELAKINMRHGEELLYFQKPTNLGGEDENVKLTILGNESEDIKINSPFKILERSEIIKPIIPGSDPGILSLNDSDSDSDTTQKNQDLLASIYLEYKGKNVDVFICDDSPPAMNHPEFLSNDDNSGKSRLHAIDWYNSKYKPLNENVPFINGPPGYSHRFTYYDQRIKMYFGLPYQPNYHGCHVAGIACGNTTGWARESNIYFSNYADYYYLIPPAVPGQLQSYTPVAWNAGEIILNFHKNKPINPHTGRKNPTIVNMSFGFFANTRPMNSISKIFYRGQMHERPADGWIIHDLIQFGIIIYSTLPTGAPWVYMHGFPGNEQDMPLMVPYIEDMIEEGIIVVVAAGNNSYKMDIPGGLDYDNYYLVDGSPDFKFYYHRGSVPATIPGTIVVGCMSPGYPEYKSWFSTTGPGVDIWAPGEGIQSAWVEHGVSDCPCTGAGGSFCSNNITKDNRNANYRMAKISGTSMAAPQITGMLACYAEKEPDITPQSAKDWLITNGKPALNDIGPVVPNVTPGSYRDFNSLQGATNKVAYFPYGSYTIIPNVISPTPTPTPTPTEPILTPVGPSPIPTAPTLPSPTTPPPPPPPPPPGADPYD